MTFPFAPLSLPAITSTVSPFLIFILIFAIFTAISEHLRRQGDDLHEPAVAQLATDPAEDAGPPRLAVPLDQDGGVLVEPDVAAVGAAALLDGAHDHGPDHVTALHAGGRDGLLDGGDDGVADSRVAPRRAAEHPDAQDLLGTGVVGDAQPRLLLDHFAFSRISTSRQRLVADSGRVSISRTRSPTPAVLASSCALTLLVRRMTLPYIGCFTRSSRATTIVLFILSETTRPSRTFRSPRVLVVSLMPRPRCRSVRPRGPARARA